ncbi:MULTISPECIES: PhnA-like protein [unclassified Methylobacterium]|uniref:PhnA-like protein n=1 Tax=unclassified Methylobacterium TaxID=2615210 RepID=UPI001FB945AE|nr:MULTISPECIES: PhnA-like protein [unclassified Methylobacterium]MCJ2092232.1 PhnA-like protein [Methylobacterium sp. J-072]MCJ2138482.1 PhnA-like protein [Methylobacterium sp. E-066]
MTASPSLSTAPLAHTSDARTVLLHQVSWGAIFAGATTALVAQVILNMLGVGIGLSSVGMNAADNPAASTLSMSAGIWFVASGIVASLIGGFLAGRLSGKPVGGAAGLHGLVSWSVTTLVVLYLLTSAVGGIVGGAFNGVATTLGGAGNLVGGTVQTAAQAAAPSLSKITNPLDGIESTVRQQASGQDPQAARDAAVAAVRAVLTGDPAQKQQAETRAADALAKAQGIPADQAKQQIQDYEKQYDQAVATAKQKAEAAAVATKSAATQGAFYAALALILGALAAFLGGRLGAPKVETLVDSYGTRRA